MRRFLVPFSIAAILSCVALFRTDFSPSKINAPLCRPSSSSPPHEFIKFVSQPFSFLGKGRQSYVFVSEDGSVVLKFFNRTYLEIPWYRSFYPSKLKIKEMKKRDLRKMFHFQSYFLAEQFLKDETGILYTHLGPSADLPMVHLMDRASRSFLIDLNQVPFVLQKRAHSLNDSFQKVTEEQQDEAVVGIIEDLFHLVQKRQKLGICDKDHDFEHNFAYLDGKLIQIDPGRLLEGVDFSHLETRRHEWWAGTHRLRKWLEKEHPQFVPVFDARLVQFNKSS